MDGRERAAAAHATGGAVARVTRAVAGTHEALTDVVRTGLAPLGPVGRLPFEASALMARFNFAAVETVARGVGAVAAPVLEASAAPDARPASEHPPAVGWLAALGGAFGDRLVADHRVRALAVPMSLRDRGALVDIDATRADDTTLDGTTLDVTATVVVFVHGLGNHESMWGQSYLDVVRAHDATAMTVRYTTGQAIADSGAELADLLDRLVAAWPMAVDRIVLVGHSMGGLVIREALAAGRPWRQRVSDVVTLGTPHSGAPLERAAVRGLRPRHGRSRMASGRRLPSSARGRRPHGSGSLGPARAAGRRHGERQERLGGRGAPHRPAPGHRRCEPHGPAGPSRGGRRPARGPGRRVSRHR
jgi:pimeloyl-ACP methyl ester carboxylesterase